MAEYRAVNRELSGRDRTDQYATGGSAVCRSDCADGSKFFLANRIAGRMCDKRPPESRDGATGGGGAWGPKNTPAAPSEEQTTTRAA